MVQMLLSQSPPPTPIDQARFLLAQESALLVGSRVTCDDGMAAHVEAIVPSTPTSKLYAHES